MKKVLIKISSVQGLNGDSDNIEFITEGTLRTNDSEAVLCYKEGELIGAKNVNTRLTVSGEKSVVIERNGDMQSRLIIERGAKNTCIYSVPQGDLTLGIFGKTINNALGENGGSLKLCYTLDANGKLLSENKLKITVKEVL